MLLFCVLNGLVSNINQINGLGRGQWQTRQKLCPSAPLVGTSGSVGLRNLSAARNGVDRAESKVCPVLTPRTQEVLCTLLVIGCSLPCSCAICMIFWGGCSAISWLKLNSSVRLQDW
jgi:hypothetical protein